MQRAMFVLLHIVVCTICCCLIVMLSYFIPVVALKANGSCPADIPMGLFGTIN